LTASSVAPRQGSTSMTDRRLEEVSEFTCNADYTVHTVVPLHNTSTTSSLSLQATHASCTVGTSQSPPLPQRWATMGRKGTGGTHLTSETKDLSLITKVIQKGLGHIMYSIDSVAMRIYTSIHYPFVCRPI